MSMHIEGRRWFQTSYGNTYHSATIYKDGEKLVKIGPEYGYGDQYLQTAVDWLKKHGLLPEEAKGSTRYLREEAGISYSVTDVSRQRDL